jgi:hypothetical protein
MTTEEEINKAKQYIAKVEDDKMKSQILWDIRDAKKDIDDIYVEPGYADAHPEVILPYIISLALHRQSKLIIEAIQNLNRSE